MLRIENEKKKKKKEKNIWLQPGLNRGGPHGSPTPRSNVTTSAPANYVFKIVESSFYIITYSSQLNSNQKLAERFLPSEDLESKVHTYHGGQTYFWPQVNRFHA